MSKNVVIVSYARTHLGTFKGMLSTVSAPTFVATDIRDRKGNHTADTS